MMWTIVFMKQRWQIFSSRTSLSGLIWRLKALQRWPHHWCYISTWELDDLPLIRFFILVKALKPSGIWIFCLHAGLIRNVCHCGVREVIPEKNYCVDSCLVFLLLQNYINFDLRCPLWDFETIALTYSLGLLFLITSFAFICNSFQLIILVHFSIYQLRFCSKISLFSISYRMIFLISLIYYLK